MPRGPHRHPVRHAHQGTKMPDRPGTRSLPLVPLPPASNPVGYPREYRSTTNPEARVTNYNCRIKGRASPNML